MKVFEDKEIVLQKALASKIVKDASRVSAKVDKVCAKIVADIEECEKKLQESNDVQKISVYSKELQEKQSSLISVFAIKNRIDMLISRNKQRVSFFAENLKNAGIYDESFAKSALDKLIKQEKDNVSNDNINLNKVNGQKIKRRYFCGELLTFVDGELDLSNESNLNVVLSVSPETLTKIIMAYPACASTLPDSVFLDVRFKQNYLKAIATYVSEASKTTEMVQVNKNLGNLLNFKTSYTKTFVDFMAGVQNLLDVTCKQQILKNRPELATEADGKLNCNEHSELLPASKKVAVLAQGLAGDVEKTEEQESEDVRKTKEQELEQSLEFSSYLESLFEDMLELEQQEAEQQEQEEAQMKEENKQIEEAKKEEKLSEEEMEQLLMGKSLTKHDN